MSDHNAIDEPTGRPPRHIAGALGTLSVIIALAILFGQDFLSATQRSIAAFTSAEYYDPKLMLWQTIDALLVILVWFGLFRITLLIAKDLFGASQSPSSSKRPLTAWSFTLSFLSGGIALVTGATTLLVLTNFGQIEMSQFATSDITDLLNSIIAERELNSISWFFFIAVLGVTSAFLVLFGLLTLSATLFGWPKAKTSLASGGGEGSSHNSSDSGSDGGGGGGDGGGD